MFWRCLHLLACVTALQAQEPITRDVFQSHLAIWTFEVSLNRQVPNKALIDINPHTVTIIKTNADRFVTEMRTALAKDITLLLAIKENEAIADHARRRGMKVYRNSFGKDEWPEWLALLDEMATAKKQSGPK